MFQTAEPEPWEAGFWQLRSVYYGNFSRRIYSWQLTRRTIKIVIPEIMTCSTMSLLATNCLASWIAKYSFLLEVKVPDVSPRFHMLLGWTQRHLQQADLKLSKSKSPAVERQPLFENRCTPGMWQSLQSTLKYIHPVSFHTQDGQLCTNLIKPKKQPMGFLWNTISLGK